MGAHSTRTVTRQWAESEAIQYLSQQLASIRTMTDTELEDFLYDAIGDEQLNNYLIKKGE